MKFIKYQILFMLMLTLVFTNGCGPSTLRAAGESGNLIQVEPSEFFLKSGYYFVENNSNNFNLSTYDLSKEQDVAQLICDIKLQQPDLAVFEVLEAGQQGRFVTLDVNSNSLRQLEENEMGGLSLAHLENGLFLGFDHIKKATKPVRATHNAAGDLVLTDQEIFGGEAALPFLFGPMQYTRTNCSDPQNPT